jgi:putative protein-disulfide isomerase
MTLIYCYDAYCGWCFGFSPVMRKVAEEYADKLAFEVLSGGMIMPEEQRHIGVMADYIQKAYQTVEAYSGVKFGEDYLWHVFNPDKSDWFLNSEKPAIALCVFKEYYADKQVQFAADLQHAMHVEGRDLTDDEAYRHLLEKYHIPAEEFYTKLRSQEYKDKAYYEFALVKQLQVTGFPTVLMQVSESKFYLLARGFTPHDTLKERIEAVLAEAKPAGQ